MHSLSSPHAMTWHRVCPFEPRLQIASHLCKMRIRQELDLPMPCLTDAHNNQRLAYCCNPPHTALEPRRAFNHLICVHTSNAGGNQTKTHDKVKFAVQAVCKLGGLITFTEPIGEIPGTRTGTATPSACDQTFESTACETPASQSSQTSPSHTSWARQPTTRANHDPAEVTRLPTTIPL